MKHKWWYFVGMTLLLSAGVAALTAMTYQSQVPANSTQLAETVKTLFAALGGAGVLLAITLNVFNSIEQRTYDKIQNTFDLLTKWDDQHLLKARGLTRAIGKMKSSMSDNELLEKINNSDDLEQSVILVLNYCEHVRFSIVQDRVVVEQFKESLGPTITGIIDRFKPYFDTKPEQVRTHLAQLKELLK